MDNLDQTLENIVREWVARQEETRMIERVFDVLIGLFGLCVILFNRKAAEDTVSYSNRVWGMYGEEDIMTFRIAFVLAGCAFVAFSLRGVW